MNDKGKLNFPVIVGTSRPKRWSIHAAKLVDKIGSSLDQVESEIVDPQELEMPLDGNAKENKDPRYTEIIEKADGFFIVVPEYNHSFPGSLKRMLDSEYKNYQYKPVAFCGVSAGPWGGVRAIEALVPVTRTFGMVPIKKDVHFPYVQEIFNKEGELIEEELDKDYQKMVEEVYGELLKMGAVLKFGRQNIES